MKPQKLMLRKIVCLKKKGQHFFSWSFGICRKDLGSIPKLSFLSITDQTDSSLLGNLIFQTLFHTPQKRDAATHAHVCTPVQIIFQTRVIKSLPPSNIKVLMDLLQNRLLNAESSFLLHVFR